MGGLGSDLIEGRGGDDLLDGDAWLNVQLRAPNTTPGTFRRTNSLQDLKVDVFAGLLNPGSIQIVRTIVRAATVVPPALPARGSTSRCSAARLGTTRSPDP